MSAHVSDELPLLLTGEASRDVVIESAAHLRSCGDCQQELIMAVVAHASLTSAQRFAPEVISGPPELASVPDPTEASSPAALPDLSQMFAKVRNEATQQRTSSRRRNRLLAAAAAAVVVAGGAAAVTANLGSDSPSGKQIALRAYGVGNAGATAVVRSGGHMEINAAALPDLSSRHYEVWLTDGKRTRMQPIGWIGPDGNATLTVPSNLMQNFSDIEVSVQDVNAEPKYSGTSVLRGAYA